MDTKGKCQQYRLNPCTESASTTTNNNKKKPKQRRTFDEQSVICLDQDLAHHVINQLDDLVLVGASMQTVASGEQIVQVGHFFIPRAELQLAWRRSIS